MSPYITSLRLRTLPLSIAGIILGGGLAYTSSWSLTGEWSVWALAVCTALCLQIVSNLCNELGDAQKGTDAHQQGREAYGLQSGKMTEKQLKNEIMVFICLTILSGLTLIYKAFGTFFSVQSGVFVALGAFALFGAVTYTLGKHSYGYYGMGDLGVFVFFGLLSTMGAYYLIAETVNEEVFWCGVAIGLPCVGVLNLNNIRDMNNDLKHGKKTFAGLLGQKGGRVYHTCLLLGCLSIFTLLGHGWTLCVLPLWGWHLWYIWTHQEKLDKQMPVLMFSTLIVSILALF